MIYQPYIPTNHLTKYINNFWYVKGKLGYKLEKIFPFARIHFIINLCEEYKLYTDLSKKEFITFDSGFISGLQEKYLIIENPDEVENIGIEFKPHGIQSFIGKDIESITNKVVNAENIFQDINILKSKIQLENDIQQKFKLLEEFISSQLNHESKAFDTVDSINNLISKNPEISLEELSNIFHYSKKHLLSLVKRYTGVTIKTLADIYKFQKVINLIENEKPSSLSELSLAGGYYDQAHFIKRFKQFSGFTPKEYLDLINKSDSGYVNFVNIDPIS